MRDLSGDLGQSIRSAVLGSKLFLEDIAKKAGISRSQISNFLWGTTDTRLTTFVRILDAVGYEIVIRKKNEN